MSQDVFISHAAEDKAVADAVYAILEGKKIRCWIAPRDVLPDSSGGRAIVEAIKESRLMVLIFSSHSNHSLQVISEVEQAASQGLPILPLRIEDVALSKDMEYFISGSHWLDALAPPLEKHLHYLADAVERLLSRSSPPKAPTEGGEASEAVDSPRPVTRDDERDRGTVERGGDRTAWRFFRRWRAVLGVFLIVGIGLLLWWSFRPSGPNTKLIVDLGGGVTMEFVLIRPGSFMMGSEKGDLDEKPVHKVTISKPFYLGKYEVTQEQWQAVMGDTPSQFKGEKNPVESVSWDDSQSFITKLNDKVKGMKAGLPTEAQWEFACRAGGTGDYCYGDGVASLGEYAWYGSNSRSTTHPVGEKKPNAWGLYDMHGNVPEWCNDEYGPYASSDQTDPTSRVLRGGSWGIDATSCRAACRLWFSRDFRMLPIGLRVVLDFPSSHQEATATLKDAIGQAQANQKAAKVAVLVARVETALAGKDKSAAEARLAELAALIPNDARMAKWRERLGALPGPKKDLKVDLGGGVTMEFILIRPGAFTMGTDTSPYAREKPAHKVAITKPFYLGKYEVTQEQWQAVMGNNPSSFKGAKNPVENVSWNDSQRFLTKLKEKASGHEFILPTEAQWEYACRAGTTTEFCYGDDEGGLGEYAWFGRSTTLPVGEKKPNGWGLYDMHGNVWEWCADWYDENYYANSPSQDPTGPSSGTDRLVRGGSYYLPILSSLRAAYRGWTHPDARDSGYGVRLVVVTARAL